MWVDWQRSSTLGLFSFCLLGGIVAPSSAQQAASADELQKANNPLAEVYALNFQNYYVPKLYGIDNDVANTFWVRGAGPVGRFLVRASLPLVTVPTGRETSESGLGDFNMFAAYLAVQSPTTSFGIGPLLAAPTATEDALGSGKWQTGAAAVVFQAASPTIQYGGLVTFQASFAGDDGRADASVLAVQSFGFWQLGGGTYLRTAPIWVFDLETGDYNVPFGFGIGKVTKVGNVVYNIFVEPQFTILHDGVGQPGFQLFTALNLQLVR